jgi:hypothetical protein
MKNYDSSYSWQFLFACVYNNNLLNIFQVRRLPAVPLHESSSGSAVLPLQWFIDKPSAEAQ